MEKIDIFFKIRNNMRIFIIIVIVLYNMDVLINIINKEKEKEMSCEDW